MTSAGPSAPAPPPSSGSTATGHHSSSQILETYSATESRITEAIEILHKRVNDSNASEGPDSDKKSNIAALAREFCVSESRLRTRWKGCQSKQERPAANRKLR